MPNITPTMYASFGQRAGAFLIDNLLFGFVLSPVMRAFFGERSYTQEQINEIFSTQGITGLFPAHELFFLEGLVVIITVFFWVRYAATPGKLFLGIKVVDEKTGNNLSIMQSVIRRLAYTISMIPLFLGIFWMIKDDKNQTWHDKFANSIVVKKNAVIHQTTDEETNSQSEKNDTFTA